MPLPDPGQYRLVVRIRIILTHHRFYERHVTASRLEEVHQHRGSAIVEHDRNVSAKPVVHDSADRHRVLRATKLASE